jgi:hypothetical protein
MIITHNSLHNLASNMGYTLQSHILNPKDYLQKHLGIKIYRLTFSGGYYVNFSTKQETLFKLKYAEYL